MFYENKVEKINENYLKFEVEFWQIFNEIENWIIRKFLNDLVYWNMKVSTDNFYDLGLVFLIDKESDFQKFNNSDHINWMGRTIDESLITMRKFLKFSEAIWCSLSCQKITEQQLENWYTSSNVRWTYNMRNWRDLSVKDRKG